MKRDQRWQLRYAIKSANGNEVERYCYPRSEEKRNECLSKCKQFGYRVISCKKLYPFNTERNQHNFMLISNICFNRMHDMMMGEIPYDDAEYSRLEAMKDKADRLFLAELPIAWLPWEDWSTANELSILAVEHRANACIEAGRADLVQYC